MINSNESMDSNDPKELDDPQLFDDPQPFDDPQLFDDQLELWTLIIQKSTVISSSPMVLFLLFFSLHLSLSALLFFFVHINAFLT